jgi:hypothetical protein
LGLQATKNYDKYLGEPTLVGKSRTRAFNWIKGRVWNCLNNWKTKFLSQANKEILIKAVAQAIPTYCLSFFQLLVGLCKEIQGMMQCCWWGHKENTSRIHWMNWERMGVSKANGGLGFHDLGAFNKALLTKQILRLLQCMDSLVGKIHQAKYYPSCFILEAKLGNRPSFVWRSIMVAQPVLQRGLIWRIGEGSDIRIWGDRWIPNPTTYMIQSPRRVLGRQARVSELIDQDTRQWKGNLVSEIFLEEEAKVTKSLPISSITTKDKLIWRCTKNGIFSVRSAYHLEMENMSDLCNGGSTPANSFARRDCWNLKVLN